MNISKVLFFSAAGAVAYYVFLRWLEDDEGGGGTRLSGIDTFGEKAPEVEAPFRGENESSIGPYIHP